MFHQLHSFFQLFLQIQQLSFHDCLVLWLVDFGALDKIQRLLQILGCLVKTALVYVCLSSSAVNQVHLALGVLSIYFDALSGEVAQVVPETQVKG